MVDKKTCLSSSGLSSERGGNTQPVVFLGCSFGVCAGPHGPAAVSVIVIAAVSTIGVGAWEGACVSGSSVAQRRA